jgi:acyl carrier protein
MDPEAVLRQFLGERFGSYREDLGRAELLEDIVDSLGLFDLVNFVEKRFSLSIPNEEFSPQRFVTIEQILETIEEYGTV